MNSLLPFDLIDTPHAILDTPMRLTNENSILETIQSAATTRTPIDPRVKRRLSHYPSLVAGLLSDPEIRNLFGARDCSDLLSNDTAALNVLLLNFNVFSPILEERLLGNAEAVNQIYVHCQRSGYHGIKTLDELATLLRHDPNRTFNITREEEKFSVAKRLQGESEEYKYRSAGWAFFYLCSHLVDRDVSLDPELLRALQGEEEYLYRAAHLLRYRRDAAPFVWKPLIAKISSPRWVYHAMWADLAEGCEDEFFRILYHAPQWCCQLVDSWDIEDLTPDQLNFHYQAMMRAAHSHELIQELHQWNKAMVHRLALAFRQVG